MRRATLSLLRWAERMFLLAHGWTYLGNDLWERPSDYDPARNGGENYRTSHAVNSQKWTNSRQQKYEERERNLRSTGIWK